MEEATASISLVGAVAGSTLKGGASTSFLAMVYGRKERGQLGG